MRHVRLFALALPTLMWGSNAVAADPPNYPPPGRYQVDFEFESKTGSGPSAYESTRQTFSETGTVVVTSKHAGAPRVSQTFKGYKPEFWCAKAETAADPFQNSPSACQNFGVAPPPGASITATCQKATENTFRRIGPTTWEHSMAFESPEKLVPKQSVRVKERWTWVSQSCSARP
jgi:hypothetical protein